MNKKERINKAYEYLKYKGFVRKQDDVANAMKSTRSNVSRALNGDAAVLTDSFVSRFAQAYAQIFSANWLLKGEGEMLLSDNDDRPAVMGDDVVMVPILSLDARGGFGANAVVDSGEYVTASVPFTRDVARPGDVVITVYGDSMTPRYPSGSMVLIRQVEHWHEYLELGVSYVIELEDDRRILKTIRRAQQPDHYLLESENSSYQPSEVPRSFIRRVFRVVASIRREFI